jgi:hypothetical protein
MDKLKQYLLTHRDELAVEEAPGEVWPVISNKLKTKQAPVISILKWAAAACIVLLAGTGVYYLMNDKPLTELVKTNLPVDSNKTNTAVNENKQDIKIPDDITKEQLVKTETPQQVLKPQTPNPKYRSSKPSVVNELDLLQQNFSVMIKYQEEKIRNTPIYAEDAGYFHFFTKQLSEMNRDENILKEEVKKTGWNGNSIEQLINIYQGKISLLKQLQFEINKMNNKAKQNNSTIQTQKPSFINI